MSVYGSHTICLTSFFFRSSFPSLRTSLSLAGCLTACTHTHKYTFVIYLYTHVHCTNTCSSRIQAKMKFVLSIFSCAIVVHAVIFLNNMTIDSHTKKANEIIRLKHFCCFLCVFANIHETFSYIYVNTFRFSCLLVSYFVSSPFNVNFYANLCFIFAN